ncbi:helix-turn-helix domain-containing protein [Leucobacter sp. L43]|uniref:helix-turn-helix domain-containing protein n=1 Tax=Leucobacter sp. L43 TaxID=2798040 RepID=UPI001904F9FA|nr:helix-turn-helix transcriptional regulator [Leucobacter sp. L43]
MAKQIEDSSWGNKISLRIAQRLRALRENEGMSAQDLANATEALGHPISRQVIANIESGRKASIGVAELFILAHCFGVNPMYLLFDMHEQDEPYEIVPDLEVPQWEAYKWAALRTNIINSYLSTSDFDEYRTAINMRDSYERSQRSAKKLIADISALRETGKLWMDKLDRGKKRLPDEEVEALIAEFSAQLESVQKDVDASEKMLDSLEVSYDDSWFDPGPVFQKYLDERWYRMSDPHG